MGSSKPLPFMEELLFSDKYSDLEIQCDNQIFKAHRAIVCSQSSFFSSAVSGDFQESHEGKIVLQEEDADTIRRFLSYLYTQDYEQGSGELTSDERSEVGTVRDADTEIGAQEANTAHQILAADTASVSEIKEIALNNLLVYVAADKFGTDSLKQLAKGRLSSWAEKNWSDECFPTVVSKIVTLEPPHETELSEILSRVVCDNAVDLVEKGSLLDVLEEFGTFTTAVLVKLVARLRQSNEECGRLIDLCVHDSFGYGLMKRMNSLTMCRHCDREFNLRVESATIGSKAEQSSMFLESCCRYRALSPVRRPHHILCMKVFGPFGYRRIFR